LQIVYRYYEGPGWFTVELRSLSDLAFLLVGP
jgi:hypothetical protein